MANDFTQILEKTLKSEGGLNVKETGGGGVSNRGITQSTLNAFNSQRGLPKQDVRNLDMRKTRQIFSEEFFIRPGFDRLPRGIGKQLFDFGVQSSPKRAIQFLQRVIGADEDGILGPQTEAATAQFIGKFGEEALVNEIIDAREVFIEELIKSQPKRFGSIQEGLRKRIQDQRGE